MSVPRQVVRLKHVQFSESLVDEAVHRAGGRRISEMVLSIPAGIQNCDYLIGGHLLELKMIELEPLEATERQQKLTRLFSELAQEGKSEVDLTGENHQQYWRSVGAPVRRHLEKAASQIRDTRALLQRPSLRGAVFLINCGGDSIDPISFVNLTSHHRRDFSTDIQAAMCFSTIPGVPQSMNRPCLEFSYEHSGDGADESFVQLFRASFNSVFANKLGKVPDEIDASDTPIQPLRTPFEIETPKGKIVIN